MSNVASITSAVRRQGAGIAITVLYTNEAATVAALHAVHDFARGLPAAVRVLVPLTVPYPLPLDRPQVNVEWLLRRVRMEASVEVLLCRDAWEGLRNRIPPSALIVIGKGRGWWPRPEDKLARKLQRAGHHVLRVLVRGDDYV